jgi:hypothetical protein
MVMETHFTMAAARLTTRKTVRAQAQADTEATSRMAGQTKKATMGAAGTVTTTRQLMDTARAAA